MWLLVADGVLWIVAAIVLGFAFETLFRRVANLSERVEAIEQWLVADDFEEL